MSPAAPSNATSTSTSRAACRSCAAAGWHQPQSALVEHEDSLEEYFLKHPPRSAKQAQAVIEQQTGIRRGLSQVRHFLKDRLGLRWRKTGAIPVPPKKTVEEHAREQAAFLQEKLEPRLEQARRGRRQVYFVDAAHFVFAPFLGCLWCAARLFVRAASGRKRYNVLGALDAVTHRLIRVTNDGYINAESVCALLRAVAEAGVGLPITLVLDNARYQKCAVVQALAASLGIELLYLPELLAQPEPDRAAVAVRAQGVAGLDLLRGFRAVHGRHRSVPGRVDHSTQGRDGNADDSQVSDV